MYRNSLYRLKQSLKIKLAILFRKTIIIEDNKRCVGKSYLIDKISKQYKLPIIRGSYNKIDKQFTSYIGKHDNIILIDTYFFNRTQYNLIRRDISNLVTYGHIIIGFNTFVGEKRWKNY